MNAHNICFCGEIRKILSGYTLLSGTIHHISEFFQPFLNIANTNNRNFHIYTEVMAVKISIYHAKLCMVGGEITN